MKTKKEDLFKKLKFNPIHFGEVKQAKIFFKNGYGASVIQGSFAYTDNDKEWELAVLKGDKEGSSLCYTTPITDDVLGHLSKVRVNNVLNKIKKLKKVK